MKKGFITFIALMLLSSIIAQEKKVSFGAKGGLNISNFSGGITDVLDYDSKFGFHIGGLAEMSLSKKMSIQFELMFSTQGASFSAPITDGTGVVFGDIVVDINYDYLNIPVLAKYYVLKGFSIQAGPQIGFLVNAKAKSDLEEVFGNENLEDVSKLDLAFSFGLGYQLKSNLLFEARYNIGLSNTDDSELSNSDFAVRNSVLQISVGYMF